MHVRLEVMGELAVIADGTQIPVDQLPRRARELLELLAVAPGRWSARDVVIDSLFGHLDAVAGAANLHKAASVLRGCLGQRDSVIVGGGGVSLWPHADVVVDLDEFERAATEALATDDPEGRVRALGLYRGEPLPRSRYEPWADSVRARIHALFTDLLRTVGDWVRLAEVEPTDEFAHREVMRELAAAGRRVGVIRQFRRLSEALTEHMATAPSAETVRLFEELTRGPAVVAPVRNPAPMVGRSVEWSSATAAVRAAADGRGSGLLVVGETGIGKTRFCEAVMEAAGADGWTTLYGSAGRTDPAPTYGAVLEAIDRLVLARPDLVQGLPEATIGVLESLLAPDEHDALSHQQVVSAIARLLSTVAGERGVLLFIDDLHDADDDTVALVQYLIRAATFQRVVVVAAVRPAGRGDIARETMRDLLDSRRATEITLGPLTRDESTELLLELLPGTAGQPSIEDTLDQAAGNPFFLEEFAAGRGPDVTRAVNAELRRFSEATRAGLIRLAVAGERFDNTDIETLAGVTADGRVDLIDDAVTAGVLVADGHDHRFRHRLVRTAVLAELDSLEQSRVHALVADALVSLGAESGRIAWHRLAAGKVDVALPIVVQAAADAVDRGGHREASRLVDHALTERPHHVELLGLRADLAFLAGDSAAPRRYAEAIAASPPALRGPLLVRQARACVAAYDPQAAKAALDAAGLLDGASPALATLVEAQIAWMASDLDGCEVLAEQARTMALTSGRIDVLFGAVSLRDLVLHQRGRWPEALQQDLMSAGDSPVLASVIHDLHLCGAEAYLYGGRPYSQVKAFARELASTAHATGAARGVAFATTLLGEAELLSGDLESADTHLVTGARLHADVGASAGEALSRQRLAQLRLVTGDRVGARAELDAALALARLNPAASWHLVVRVYGTMVEAAEDSAEALDVVAEGELGAAGGMAQACPPCSIAFWIPAAIAYADGGDPGRATQALVRAEPWVDALWAQSGWKAALDEARGHVALAEGHRARALALLTSALDRFLLVGQPLDAQRCETTLASFSR